MITEISKFIDTLFENVPIAIIIIESVVIFFLLRGWFKHLAGKVDKILGNQTLATIDRQSMDAALNKCLVGNGKSYAEHKQTEKSRLIKELKEADEITKTKKKNFFSL